MPWYFAVLVVVVSSSAVIAWWIGSMLSDDLIGLVSSAFPDRGERLMQTARARLGWRCRLTPPLYVFVGGIYVYYYLLNGWDAETFVRRWASAAVVHAWRKQWLSPSEAQHALVVCADLPPEVAKELAPSDCWRCGDATPSGGRLCADCEQELAETVAPPGSEN